MIPEYIDYWMTIIKTMSNQNTYKLAWGRAILEYVSTVPEDESSEGMIIKISDLADIVMKYYWNQIFFFHLNQAPNDNAANIIDATNEMIELYKVKAQSSLPKWYDGGKKEIENTPEFKKAVKTVTRLLRDNPATYFPNASLDGKRKKEALPVYTLVKGTEPYIVIKYENVSCLKEYNDILVRLLNYKWAMLLENYNFVPRINEKVTAISDGEVERKSLKEYEKVLIEATADNKAHDFYSEDNAVIPDKEISVDHVIPWSFMYSDDIWNLVLTTKSHNSQKSNTIPSEDTIKRLKIRNILLVDSIREEKYKTSLKLSIENNYIDKYYYQCKVAN